MFRRTFRKYDDLNASVQENVTNIRVVKAYVKETAETNKFQEAAGNLKKMFMKAENILVFNNPVMQLTMYCCILALSWMGAQMIVGSTLTTGELMSLFTYTMNILMSLMMLSMIFVMLSMSMASAQRIAEILEEKPSIVNPENPVMTVADGSIEFDHVAFGYYTGKDKYVLEDINLKIKAGETIGILGPTGSSKSTLMSCTMPARGRFASAESMFGIMIWIHCATASRWYCRKTSCFPGRSRITCAGATNRPRMRK